MKQYKICAMTDAGTARQNEEDIFLLCSDGLTWMVSEDSWTIFTYSFQNSGYIKLEACIYDK